MGAQTEPRAGIGPRQGVACQACPLRALPAFRRDTGAEIDFIQRIEVGETTIRARTALFAEGQTSPRLYTLLSGWGFRYKMLPDGRR